MPGPDAVESSHALREAIFRLIDCSRAEGGAAVSEADRVLVNAAAGQDIPVPYLD